MCIFSFDLVHSSSSLSLPNSFIHFFPSFLLHILQALSLLIPFVVCTFIYSPFFSEQYVLTSLSTFLNSWSWLNSTLNFCWVLVAFVSPFIKQISSGKKNSLSTSDRPNGSFSHLPASCLFLGNRSHFLSGLNLFVGEYYHVTPNNKSRQNKIWTGQHLYFTVILTVWSLSLRLLWQWHAFSGAVEVPCVIVAPQTSSTCAVNIPRACTNLS